MSEIDYGVEVILRERGARFRAGIVTGSELATTYPSASR